MFVLPGGVFGNLLVEAWIDQLFRSIAGDRVYHFHGRIMETVYETTLSDVINRTLNVHDLPLSTFTVPGVTVCASDCGAGVGEADVTLSDAFGMSWQVSSRATNHLFEREHFARQLLIFREVSFPDTRTRKFSWHPDLTQT